MPGKLRRLSIEFLEDRQLLTTNVVATYAADTNTLTIVGTEHADLVLLLPTESGDLQILSQVSEASDRSAPATANLDIQLFGGDDLVAILPSEFDLVLGQIAIDSGPGQDSVEVAGAIASSVSVSTGPGNDSVIVGSVFDSVATEILNVSTGAANDAVTLIAISAGSLLVETGSGDDEILMPSSFSVIADSVFLTTGAGNDTLYLEGLQTPTLAIATGAGNDSISIVNSFVGEGVVEAGSGDDTVSLTNLGLDSIMQVWCGSGSDVVQLNSALDATSRLDGGAGDDELFQLGGTLPDDIDNFESVWLL